MVLHLGQALKYRAWWLLPTAVLATLGETLGWSGRLWSSYAPLNQTPFFIQIVCTIVAPTPLIGAIFITFGRVIKQIGLKYSRLNARLYSRIFLTCDVVGFLVQSVGGGIAASAPEAHPEIGRLGSNIMLSGIVFQLASLTVFCVLAAQYFWRYRQDSRRSQSSSLLGTSSSETIASSIWIRQPLSKQVKLLVLGICLETLFLYIRAIYRTIELADGFSGRIIQTQVYFNVLDGAMVVLAMYTLSILHPARLLDAIAVYPGSIPLMLK
ncbi:RTA1 like protein [Lentinus tigrinus ALCF2SS1-7]|uniref:RTA1 like protein n=1 Tax=Lentinus tigrinus ALCF2SS1-7 TaxID=1328758 RepID=UPI0011662DAC|nr:RTA1 like protein [Lentinus tigrinus ALCF2SS1-7]